MESGEELFDELTNATYDDAFRTLLNDCPALVISLINEVFHEHYTGNERVEFRPNEHFLNQQDGREQKRVTDTYFVIYGPVPKGYHIECQSTEDGAILIRIFEYDAQIALDDARLEGNVLRVTFPHSALLSLRSTASTPDEMAIVIETPGGTIQYAVPVIKARKYGLEEIFQKRLLFLLPFYIFSHESRFAEYDRDSGKLGALVGEYETIRERLDGLAESGELSEYMKCTIVDMAKVVLALIAKNHPKVREGVRKVMGGRILDHEAKDILRRGIFTTLADLVRDGILSIKDAAARAGMSEQSFLAQMQAL